LFVYMLLMVLTCSSVVISILCEGWSNSTELIRLQQQQQRELDRLKAMQKEANDLHLLQGVMADASDQEIQDLASNYDDAADQAQKEIQRRRDQGGVALDDSMLQIDLTQSGSTGTSSTRNGNGREAGKKKAERSFSFGVFGELAVLDGLIQSGSKVAKTASRLSRTSFSSRTSFRKSSVASDRKSSVASDRKSSVAIDPVDFSPEDGHGSRRRTTFTSDREIGAMQTVSKVVSDAITTVSQIANVAGDHTDDDLLHEIQSDTKAEGQRLEELIIMRARRLGQR